MRERMHWTYAFYLFACTVHAPIFLTLIGVGKYVPCTLLVLGLAKNISNAEPPLCLVPVKGSLSSDAGFAALLAVIFGLLFMAVTSDSNEQVLDEDSGTIKVAHLALRVCFWCIVWFQGCVMHGGWSEPVTVSDLYVVTGLRVLALWCICRTSPDDRGWVSFIGAVFVYLLWLIVFFKKHFNNNYYYHNNSDNRIYKGFPVPLVIVQLILDALLTLGHRYDEHTSRKVVLNCRLCYVALAGFIGHIAALCMS